MKNFREIKGITLVALIIMIIVMLILAGISISMIRKSNLLDKTKLASEKYKNKSDEEQETLSSYTNAIDNYDIAETSRDTISKEEYNKLLERIENLEKNTTSAFEMEQLVDYVHPTTRTRYTLKQSLNNYRYLYFVFGRHDETYNTYIMSIEDFKKEKQHNLFFAWYGGTYTYYYYVDDSKIDILQTGEWDCSLYGIK